MAIHPTRVGYPARAIRAIHRHTKTSRTRKARHPWRADAGRRRFPRLIRSHVHHKSNAIKSRVGRARSKPYMIRMRDARLLKRSRCRHQKYAGSDAKPHRGVWWSERRSDRLHVWVPFTGWIGGARQVSEPTLTIYQPGCHFHPLGRRTRGLCS